MQFRHVYVLRTNVIIFFLSCYSFWHLTCSCWSATGGTLWTQRSMCSEPSASTWMWSTYSFFSFSSLGAVSEVFMLCRGFSLCPLLHTHIHTHTLLSYSKVWWGANSLPSFCVAVEVWCVLLFSFWSWLGSSLHTLYAPSLQDNHATSQIYTCCLG